MRSHDADEELPALAGQSIRRVEPGHALRTATRNRDAYLPRTAVQGSIGAIELTPSARGSERGMDPIRPGSLLPVLAVRRIDR